MPATGIRSFRRDDGVSRRAALSLSAALCGALLTSPASSATLQFGTFAPFAGAAPASVETRTLDGAPLTVAADSDRVVLLHFFASWCEPCVDELPALVSFVQAQRDKVRLIGINVAEPASRARKFAERFGLPGAIALDQDKSVTSAFLVRGLPATVALAPGGGGALSAAGPLDWTAPSTAEAIASLVR